jgi:hypothetical protein
MIGRLLEMGRVSILDGDEWECYSGASNPRHPPMTATIMPRDTAQAER